MVVLISPVVHFKQQLSDTNIGLHTHFFKIVIVIKLQNHCHIHAGRQVLGLSKPPGGGRGLIQGGGYIVSGWINVDCGSELIVFTGCV